MPSLFLDTHILIDIFGRPSRSIEDFSQLDNFTVYVSTTSLLDLVYIKHESAPSELVNVLPDFIIVSVDSDSFQRALLGPTKDIEDNALLHTAVSKDCDLFLTKDAEILKLGFFGKMQIVSKI